MKEIYCVYLTFYKGNKLPKWYIGSSNENKILKGYNGSIKSKKWKEIYNLEQKENKHLFKTRILSKHVSREEALKEELRLQKKHNVVKNNNYFNESYASINGMFGRDVSGENNPMFEKTHKLEVKQKLSLNNINKVQVIDKLTNNKLKINKDEFTKNDNYVGVTSNKCVLRNIKTGEIFHGNVDLIDNINIEAESKNRKQQRKRIYYIYDENNILLHTIKDNLYDYCEKYNLPSKLIMKYSKLNDIITYRKGSQLNKAISLGRDKFIGWRVLKVKI